jgi:hypothetical protein
MKKFRLIKYKQGGSNYSEAMTRIKAMGLGSSFNKMIASSSGKVKLSSLKHFNANSNKVDEIIKQFGDLAYKGSGTSSKPLEKVPTTVQTPQPKTQTTSQVSTVNTQPQTKTPEQQGLISLAKAYNNYTTSKSEESRQALKKVYYDLTTRNVISPLSLASQAKRLAQTNPSEATILNQLPDKPVIEGIISTSSDPKSDNSLNTVINKFKSLFN